MADDDSTASVNATPDTQYHNREPRTHLDGLEPNAVEDSDAPLILVKEWRTLLVKQLEQCWSDIRQNDAILWQIPASIGAIVALLLNVLGQSIVAGPVS